MGVDIGFHIEVRKESKWIPVVWKMPRELAGYVRDCDEEKVWIEKDEIISGRYYHFDDFLKGSAGRHGLPDDITERFKTIFKDEHETWGIGYFYLTDLNSYLQQAEINAITRMLEKRNGKIAAQLNRIEALLSHNLNLEKATNENPDEDYETEESVYEEYLDDTFLVRKVRDIIRGITEEMWVEDSDVRVLYFAC